MARDTVTPNYVPKDKGWLVTTGRLLPKPSTQPSDEQQQEPNPYEEQDQAYLRHHGAVAGWLERDEQGLLESAVVMYPDGTEDLTFHNNSGEPTTQHFVTLSPTTQPSDPKPQPEQSDDATESA